MTTTASRREHIKKIAIRLNNTSFPMHAAEGIVDTIDAMIDERMAEQPRTIYRDDSAALREENERLRVLSSNADAWRSALGVESERHRAALARAEKAEAALTACVVKAPAEYAYKYLPEEGGYVTENDVIPRDTIATMREVPYIHDHALSAIASLLDSHEVLRARMENAEAALAAIHAEQTPVAWANRYPEGWRRLHKTEVAARSAANASAIEIAAPLYRHPAPAGKVCGYAGVKNGRVTGTWTVGNTQEENRRNALRMKNSAETLHELHLGREVKEDK